MATYQYPTDIVPATVAFDWGWLGWICLAGLLGGRKAADVHHVDTTRSTGQR
jgi:hypothetical protein